MPLATKASRPSKESTSDVAVSRVRPSPRSSNTRRSRATPSGTPSKVKVWTMSSDGRTSWKQPWKPYSSPSRDVHVAVRPAGAAVEVVDPHLEAARPEPLDDELGVGVGPEDLRRAGRRTRG